MHLGDRKRFNNISPGRFQFLKIKNGSFNNINNDMYRIETNSISQNPISVIY